VKIFNFSAPPAFWQELRAVAKKLDMSASCIIRLAVRDWIQRRSLAG